MLYCGNCGKEVTDNSGICKQCGEPVPRLDGAEIYDGSERVDNSHEHVEKASKSIGLFLNIVSFFSLIIGLVVFFCYRETDPKTALSCLRWSGIGFLMQLILSVTLIILMPFMV